MSIVKVLFVYYCVSQNYPDMFDMILMPFVSAFNSYSPFIITLKANVHWI